MIQVAESDVARQLDLIRSEGLSPSSTGWAYRGAISLAYRLGLVDRDEWKRRVEECAQLMEDAQ